VTPARPTRERLGIAAQQMLKPVGINVNVQRVAYNRYEAEISGKTAFYTDGFFARSTIDTAIYPLYYSTGTWNNRMWFFKSEQLDKTLNAARATKDPAELKKLYDQFQEIIVKENPGIVAYTVNFANGYSKRLKGFSTHPYGWLDLRNATIER
jgi:peptide/nickel transport system substrate-binding protein